MNKTCPSDGTETSAGVDPRLASAVAQRSAFLPAEALAFIDELRKRGPLAFEGFGIKVSVTASSALPGTFGAPQDEGGEKRMTAAERMAALNNPLVKP